MHPFLYSSEKTIFASINFSACAIGKPPAVDRWCTRNRVGNAKQENHLLRLANECINLAVKHGITFCGQIDRVGIHIRHYTN